MLGSHCRQWSTNGHAAWLQRELIEPTTKTTSPKALQLTMSAGKVGVDFGDGNLAAKVESNNNIQLKFKAGEFVGEYFHYTGDLFLIYKSGHLARLTCKGI
jgi:hypothetical protein